LLSETGLKGIHPPEDGWEPHTWYLVEVSYKYTNPVHMSLFHSGFLSEEGKPAGYNCLIPLIGVASGDHVCGIREARYLKVVRVLYQGSYNKKEDSIDEHKLSNSNPVT